MKQDAHTGCRIKCGIIEAVTYSASQCQVVIPLKSGIQKPGSREMKQDVHTGFRISAE